MPEEPKNELRGDIECVRDPKEDPQNFLNLSISLVNLW